jgi:uncharacterized SAM-binding protein YcdF (DUF218 family)
MKQVIRIFVPLSLAAGADVHPPSTAVAVTSWTASRRVMRIARSLLAASW